MKSICVAALPDLYVIRWLSRFLKHVFPRSRSNARAYSRILSPSTSGSDHNQIHQNLNGCITSMDAKGTNLCDSIKVTIEAERYRLKSGW